MKQKDIVFCTYVSDEFYHSIGADKLVKSAAHFHPNIPMIVFGSDKIKEFDTPFGLIHPFIMERLIEKYRKVVYFDADSIIVGKLHEILDADGYDIIGVRNNNDFGKAGKDEPLYQYGVPTDKYLNAGLVASSNKEFIVDWKDSNLAWGHLLPFKEQSVLNHLSRKYKTLMLDPEEANVYYGVSALSGEETHWDSWKDIEIHGDDFILNDKVIKVLHHAGGFSPNKLGYYMFNKQTRNKLIDILEK